MLKRWKEKLGLRTTIVSIETLGNDREKIKRYVRQAKINAFAKTAVCSALWKCGGDYGFTGGGKAFRNNGLLFLYP